MGFKVSDDFKRLREAIAGKTPGKLDVRGSIKNGAEIWVLDDQGSMLMAKMGHAGFDFMNARCFALLGTVAPELMAVVDAADKWRQCTYIDYLEGCCPHIADCGDQVVKALDALKAALREGK